MIRSRRSLPSKRAAAALLAALALAHGLAVADPQGAGDRRATNLAFYFMQACLGSRFGRPEATRAWAAARHLPQVTSALGQRTYVGEGSDGAAWFFQVGNTHAVVSIRSRTGACAIFGDAADPVAFQRLFHKIVSAAQASHPQIQMTDLKDDHQPGPFGQRVGKVVLLRPFPGAGAETIFTLITNERPEGPYQVSMQVAALPEGASASSP